MREKKDWEQEKVYSVMLWELRRNFGIQGKEIHQDDLSAEA
jgi:hypothetical protein